MIRNIVFDLGGVLFKLNRDEALRRFAALGVPRAKVEEMLDPYLQSGIFLDVETGRLSADEFVQALSSLAGRSLQRSDVANAYLGFIEEIQAYKFDYIDELKDKYRIYILSNTNPFVMELAESDHFLPNGRRLSSYCVYKYASCDMGVVKPYVEIFQQMLEHSGMRAEETIFVEDGTANVATARSLGFHTLQPLNGEDWRKDLAAMLRELA